MTHRHFVVAALVGSGIALVSSGAPLGAAADQAAPGARLLNVKDTQNFVTVGSPAISPDDRWVLYTSTVRDWDDAQWRTKTHIWRVKLDGTGARRLTYGDANTTTPAWFPDGSRLAFLSSRASA